VNSCEFAKKPSGFINGGEFFHQLGNYHFLKDDSTP
jgi:hypothetical protein